MLYVHRVVVACVAGLLAAGCGGGSKEPADATPPEVSFDVHVIHPDGSRAGHYTSGQVTAPIAINAVDRIEVVAQAKDTETGAKSITVNATIQVSCTLPDKTVKQLPEVQKTVAQLVRASKAGMVMATQSGPATELFGLKCDPPAVSGTANIRLIGTGENFVGMKGTVAPVDIIAELKPY